MINSTLNTRNVNLALEEYANTHNYPLEKLDFTLLGVQSYIKTCHLESFVKFHDAYKKEYESETKIIKDNAQFLQIYKITIHEKKKKNIQLKYRIESGEFYTYPICILSTDSILPIAELNEHEMLKLLYSEINKIKVKHKILINIFSSCLIKDLKSFVTDLYKNGFSKDVPILLFEGIDPEVSKPSEVIYNYKEKSTNRDEKVTEVEGSELIITYLKPIYGEAGLNAHGQRISQGNSKNTAKLEYQIDNNTINVQDSATFIKYYSKKRGFVSILNNTLSISNKIVLENIKRSEGKLTQKEENEVSVVISQTDVTKDSVGEGVELISENIHITGHTGAHSNIEAKEVTIDGATHQDSFVTAKMANINRHKGTLRCHTAKINSLEGGTIYATHVTVNTALGGSIYAENVTIKSIKHNLKVFASKSITIERVLGEDNYFTIDYRKLPVLQSKLRFLQDELDDLKWKYEDSLKHSPEKRQGLKEEIDNKEAEINEIKLSHYDAVVTIMAPVNGLNTIEYKIAEKQQSIIYRTKEAKTFAPFSIRKEDDKITLDPVNISIDL